MVGKAALAKIALTVLIILSGFGLAAAQPIQGAPYSYSCLSVQPTGYSFNDMAHLTVTGQVMQSCGFTIQLNSLTGYIASTNGTLLAQASVMSLPSNLPSGQWVNLQAQASSSIPFNQFITVINQPLHVHVDLNACVLWSFGSWSQCIPLNYSFDQTLPLSQLLTWH